MIRKLAVIGLCLCLVHTTLGDDPEEWYKLSVLSQNAAYPIIRAKLMIGDEIALDQSHYAEGLNAVEQQLESMVEAGILKKSNVELNFDKLSELLYNKPDYINELEKQYGTFAVHDMLGVGPEIYFKTFQVDQTHNFTIRLPEKELKTYLALLIDAESTNTVEKQPTPKAD